MTPPPPSPPVSPSEPQASVESWLRPARVVWVLVAGALGFGGTAAAAYYGATNKLERVADTAESARTEARAASASVSQLRADLERQRREEQDKLDKRLSQLAAERAEDRERLIRMEENSKHLTGQMQSVGGDIRVLLDRVNATPRTRTARDYPQ